MSDPHPIQTLIAQLTGYVKHRLDCKRGKVIEPVPCPSCGYSMRRVRNTSGYLNDDQFDAVKAGDWFCKRHDAECVYRWDRDCPKHDCTCGLEALLAASIGPQEPAPRSSLDEALREYRAASAAAPFVGEAGYIDDFQRRVRRLREAEAKLLEAASTPVDPVLAPSQEPEGAT